MRGKTVLYVNAHLNSEEKLVDKVGSGEHAITFFSDDKDKIQYILCSMCSETLILQKLVMMTLAKIMKLARKWRMQSSVNAQWSITDKTVSLVSFCWCM